MMAQVMPADLRQVVERLAKSAHSVRNLKTAPRNNGDIAPGPAPATSGSYSGTVSPTLDDLDELGQPGIGLMSVHDAMVDG